MASAFWERIDREIAKYDLLQHPFYQAWSNGELTREDLKFYAVQYYRHVSAFPSYLTALHSRLPEGALRRSVLANAYEEECSGVAHSDLWLRFSEGIGRASNSVAPSSVPEVDNLVNTFREIAQQAPAATALGAFYAYESQVPRIAAEKRAGLQKYYGTDERTCSYFSLHETADVHHANVWRKLLDSLAEQDANCAEEALEGVTRASRALWEALDGIERELPGRRLAHCAAN
jgi:pyrroloquinoline-quinone synthase